MNKPLNEAFQKLLGSIWFFRPLLLLRREHGGKDQLQVIIRLLVEVVKNNFGTLEMAENTYCNFCFYKNLYNDFINKQRKCLYLYTKKLYEMNIIIKWAIFSCLQLLLVCVAKAQKSDRDSNYYNIERKVTRELQKENPKECLRIYMALNKKYKMSSTSVYEFRNIAMANQDSAAFVECGRLHILYSADSVKDFVNEIEPGFDIKTYPKLTGAYSKLKSEEGPLIKKARLALNFKWIEKLNYLIGFDQGFRYSGREAFKTLDSFYFFMFELDSTNLAELSTFIKEHGFPTMSELGLEWGKLQPLLHHLMALTHPNETGPVGSKQNDKKCRADFLGFWPKMYAATIKGEFTPSFYNYVYSHLESNFKKYNLDEDIRFLQQYKPIMVFK